MLAIRPTCEHCNKSLPYDAEDAKICTFECTFCAVCVTEIFKEVCPNCGGNFTQRPIRPKHLLEKYPPSEEIIHKPVDLQAHLKRIQNL